MSMLKWYRRDDGYRRSTQGGSSITTPASQMTSQDLMVWLKLSGGSMSVKSGQRRAELTAWKLINKQGADAHYILAICMGPTVYSCLIWKGSIDA
jgi:hypothetical protein